MKKVKRRSLMVAGVATALSLSLVLSGCSSQSASTSKAYKYGSITIPAKNGALCGAANYVAYEKGFFKKEGLKANLVAKPTNISDLEAGFASGKYDALNGDFQYLPAIQNGAKIKAIGGLHQGCIKVLVPQNSAIHTLKQLKGKAIGTPGEGSTAQNVAAIALNHVGINPQTGVQWKVYDYDLLSQAAVKGQVAAIATVDPFAYQAQKQDHFRTLVDNGNNSGMSGMSSKSMSALGMKKNGTCCYLYVSDKLVQQNPKKAAAIARAYQEAAQWISKHPEATAKIELDKKYVASSKFVTVQNVTNLLKSYRWNFTTTRSKSDLTYYINQLKKTGFLKSDTNTQALLKEAYYDPFSK
ncbi:MAG: ABC transporter substrate-binding protein [Sporolactobacillus sp.]